MVDVRSKCCLGIGFTRLVDAKIQLDRRYIISSKSKPSVEITSNANVGQTIVFNLNATLI